MDQKGYISTEKAREELGENFYILKRWMREKGINNMTQIGKDKYVDEIFITKRQLKQFVAEQIRDFKGSDSLNDLYGQTREHLSRGKRK